MTSPGSGDEIGRFLTLADAAEILAVDVAAVDELIRSGELPAIRVGTAGPWRIERLQLGPERVDVTRRRGGPAAMTKPGLSSPGRPKVRVQRTQSQIPVTPG